MARLGIGKLAVALTFAVLALAGPLRAQTLESLTVESFTLSADTAHPKIEEPFHLIVALRVRERVTQIDDLELPILAELELLGDERRVVTDSSGTQYRETITVVAHHTGSIAIAPATLQAIDARDGHPKQYFTNPLTLAVSGGSLEPLAGTGTFADLVTRYLGRAILLGAGVLCAILLGVLFLRRPRAVAHVPAAPAPVTVPRPAIQPTAPRSRRDRLQDALTVLRAEPTRASAVRVRTAVWSMVGASEGETLADVLQRPQAGDARTRDVLRALERAAFTYDADLRAAIEDACNALERALA